MFFGIAVIKPKRVSINQALCARRQDAGALCSGTRGSPGSDTVPLPRGALLSRVTDAPCLSHACHGTWGLRQASTTPEGRPGTGEGTAATSGEPPSVCPRRPHLSSTDPHGRGRGSGTGR